MHALFSSIAMPLVVVDLTFYEPQVMAWWAVKTGANSMNMARIARREHIMIVKTELVV